MAAAGILITKYAPVINITKPVCQKIDELKNIPIFKPKIRLSTTVAETTAVRKTTFEYKAAADY